MDLNIKNWSKKQKIISGAVLIALIAGGSGAGYSVHQSNVHAQQVQAQKKAEAKKEARLKTVAREKEIVAEKTVTTLLASATKNPSDQSIKAVNDAIVELTNQKLKTTDTDLVKGLNNRLTLIKKAQAAVKDYQAHGTDAIKQKAAQAALNALKDKEDADVKGALQKTFDATNKQAQQAADATKAKQAAQVAATQQAQQNQAPAQNTDNGASAPASNSDNSQGWVAANGGNTSSASYTGGGTSNAGNSSNYSAPAQTPATQTPNSSTGGDQLDNWNSPKNQAILDQGERADANAPAPSGWVSGGK